MTDEGSLGDLKLLETGSKFCKSGCKQVFIGWEREEKQLFMQQLGKGQDLHINSAAAGLGTSVYTGESS